MSKKINNSSIKKKLQARSEVSLKGRVTGGGGGGGGVGGVGSISNRIAGGRSSLSGVCMWALMHSHSCIHVMR